MNISLWVLLHQHDPTCLDLSQLRLQCRQCVNPETGSHCTSPPIASKIPSAPPQTSSSSSSADASFIKITTWAFVSPYFKKNSPCILPHFVMFFLWKGFQKQKKHMGKLHPLDFPKGGVFHLYPNQPPTQMPCRWFTFVANERRQPR